MTIRLIFIFLVLMKLSTTMAQQGVDFISGSIEIRVDPIAEFIEGNVTYQFDTSQRSDSIALDARQLNIIAVKINRKKVEFHHNGSVLVVYRKFKSDKTYELSIAYEGRPEKALYFLGWEDDIPYNNQVWTQGQGKYSSHWVPSFDDMSEKLIFDMKIAFDKDYELAANGNLKQVEFRDSLKIWHYSMKAPMSSYLLAFAAGLYETDTILSSSGIPLIQYSYSRDSDKKEPTYRYTKEIMDFLEKEIGIDYPWQNYKQLPVRDFLYAGMENTGTTVFSDGYYIDSLAFEDRNFVDINAHEMAHQWFGNLVTEYGAEDHWLHEGFATYYSLLARKEIFGEEYFHWELFEMANRLKAEKGQSLTDPGANSLTFYEKGAWALLMLRDRVGDTGFRRGIQRYLKEYAFTNVSIADFLKIIQVETELELDAFKEQWLLSSEFPMETAIDYLKENSTSIRDWLLLRRELSTSSQSNEAIIKRYWTDAASVFLKKKVLEKFIKSLSIEFLRDIFNSGNPELRKMLAIHTERIPAELKTEFESLLDDDSYVSRENALFKLWIYFPADRASYLNRTRGLIGLPNYNIRILWLFLATLSQDFDNPEARAAYKEELFGYTRPEYPYEIRQNAFALIMEVFELSDQNLRDLANASVHQVWQFRSFARNLLSELIEDEKQKKRLQQLVKGLNQEEQRYLTKQLEVK